MYKFVHLHSLVLRQQISPSLATKFPLALSHVSGRAQHRGHQNDIGKRDPYRSWRPAEVFVAVRCHVVPFDERGILAEDAMIVPRHCVWFAWV